MARGAAIAPPEFRQDGASPPVQVERPTIFRLYEQNIGVLTPLMAERLVDAMETYPRIWIEEAISEAVSYNRRNWRYINRILENWEQMGRGDDGLGNTRNEKHRSGRSSAFDPDQYRDGRYLKRSGDV
jgi:DNA replication protein